MTMAFPKAKWVEAKNFIVEHPREVPVVITHKAMAHGDRTPAPLETPSVILSLLAPTGEKPEMDEESPFLHTFTAKLLLENKAHETGNKHKFVFGDTTIPIGRALDPKIG